MLTHASGIDGLLATLETAAPSRPAPGKRTLTMGLPGLVQRKIAVGGDASSETIERAAARGVTTPTAALPYQDTVQASFGRHRIDHVQVHTGAEAASTAASMRAEAYAVGDHIVLGGLPTLHTVAHEAAHVVQQRAGVARKGGPDGDVFERHADAVADAVVAGRSAESLLDEVVGGAAPGAAPAPTVQRIIKVGTDTIDELPDEKGTCRGSATRMLNNPKKIYTFSSPAALASYIRGERVYPTSEDNPEYKDEAAAEDEVGSKKRKNGRDRNDGGATKKKAKEDDGGDEEEKEEAGGAGGDDGGLAIYDRDLTLQTIYATLSISHRGLEGSPRATAAQVGGYEVDSLVAKDRRPPVADLDNQGQHKVAWRAIWAALARCKGQNLEDAHATMDQIISLGCGGEFKITERPMIAATMNRVSPPRANELILKAHNYLIARQSDEPSWESDDPDQLAGKGETALKKPLAAWQQVGAETKPSAVQALFRQDDTNPMNKLFDTLGRTADEVTDVVDRARQELRIHNPAAFAAHRDLINAWLESRKPAEAGGEEEVAA